jgi:hypothetical protein
MVPLSAAGVWSVPSSEQVKRHVLAVYTNGEKTEMSVD